MAYRIARDQFGNLTAYRSYKDKDGNQQWVPDPNYNIADVTPKELAYKTPEERANVKAAEDAMIEMRGPEAVMRKAYVDTMPFFSRIPLAAQREGHKLWAGAKDFGYNLKGGFDMTMASSPLEEQAAWKAARQKIEALKAEEDKLDTAYKEFDESQHPANVIGRMLPYILGERLVYPGVMKAVKPLEKYVNAGLENVAEGGKSLLRTLKTPIEGTSGQTFIEALKTLPKRTAANIHNPNLKPPYIADPYYEGMASDFLAGTLLSGLEGGLHYDNTMLNGLVAGAAGSLTGSVIKPHVTNAPIFYNQTGKDLLDWYRSKGAGPFILPGLATGNRAQQKFEHALRAANDWTNALKRRDIGSDIVDNRILKTAMGMKGPDIENFSPEVLKAHKQSLKTDLDNFQSNSKAAFSGSDIKDIAMSQAAARDNLALLKGHSSPEDRLAAKKAREYQIRLRNDYTRVKDPTTGKFDHAVMDGDKFAQTFKYLRNDINKAYAAKDLRTANALEPIKTAMENALDRGVTKYQGTAGSDYYRDLRERYAITQLGMEHALTPTGGFEGKKLSAHFMANDPERLLTETAGPRMNDLYKLVKINQLKREQLGSDLSGLGMAGYSNTDKQSMAQRFLTTPAAGMVPLIPDIMLGLYAKGWPSRTGLLGMSGKGFGNPSMYTRSAAQASQLQPALVDAAIGAYDSGKEKLVTMEDYIRKALGY